MSNTALSICACVHICVCILNSISDKECCETVQVNMSFHERHVCEALNWSSVGTSGG